MLNASRLKVLFLCTGNSCRSQMAEGWARHLKSNTVEAWAAGIERHGLNPLAVAVMAEAGVDISRQHSKLVAEFRGVDFDYVRRRACGWPVTGPGQGRGGSGSAVSA